MSFRDNLKETLDFLGIEQKELAAKTGISLKTIENYVKKDSSVPSADKAVLIAQALGVTVEYLICGENPKKSEISALPPKNKEILAILPKLSKYNNKVLSSLAKSLLNLQKKDSP